MDDIDRIAADVRSSASLLFEDAVRLLTDARRAGPAEVGRLALRLCRAQPSMGAFWNAAAAALAPSDELLPTLVARARRAPAAIARVAADLLATDDGAATSLRIITCSRSRTVEACIHALAERRDLTVACAEGRPGMEGQALAGALGAVGLRVELFTDAAIAAALGPDSVVLVGADAVAARWFINKTGTGQLCSAALLAGVPAYAVTGREKFVALEIARRLHLREGDPNDVLEWGGALVAVRNPLFERVPFDHVAGVITDTGLLAGDMIAAACESAVPTDCVSELLTIVADLAGPEPA